MIAAEFDKYVDSLRTELAELPRCSKRWWKFSGQLLDKIAPRTSSPSLKTVDGHRLHQPALKAHFVADTFAAKSILPDNIGAIDVDERKPAYSIFLKSKSNSNILALPKHIPY